MILAGKKGLRIAVIKALLERAFHSCISVGEVFYDLTVKGNQG